MRRKVAVWSLVGLASLLALVSSLTVWTKRQLLSTDAWTNTSAQMLADPTIRSAVSNRLVDGLFRRVDVAGELRAQLPEQAQALAPAAAVALQTAAVRATNAFLTTPQAQALWEKANRRAHAALVRVLEGKSVGPISTAHGAVVLDVRPMLSSVASRLGIAERLRAHASPSTGEIVLLRSDQIKAAQTSVRALHFLSVFLSLVVLALYAAAIVLARGHRRTVLEASGATLVLVGLILLVVRRIAGAEIIDSLVKTQADRPPIHIAWLLETAMLRDIALGLVLYGIGALAGGLLAGPSRPAVAIRRRLAPTFRRSPLIPQGAGFVLFLMVVAWGPTAGSRRLIGVLILWGLVIVGVEALRRQTLREFSAGGGETPDDAAYEAARKPALN
jgi:hypothetical protein